ncbi:hypothetical protein RI367_003084 [Sorochytrium milnesiophthora]
MEAERTQKHKQPAQQRQPPTTDLALTTADDRERLRQIEAAPATPTTVPSFTVADTSAGPSSEMQAASKEPPVISIDSLLGIKDTATRALDDILRKLVSDAQSSSSISSLADLGDGAPLLGDGAAIAGDGDDNRVLTESRQRRHQSFSAAQASSSLTPAQKSARAGSFSSPPPKSLMASIRSSLQQRRRSVSAFEPNVSPRPVPSVSAMPAAPANSLAVSDTAVRSRASTTGSDFQARSARRLSMSVIQALSSSASSAAPATSARAGGSDLEPKNDPAQTSTTLQTADYDLACALTVLLEGVYGLLDENAAVQRAASDAAPSAPVKLQISDTRRIELWTQLQTSMQEISIICQGDGAETVQGSTDELLSDQRSDRSLSGEDLETSATRTRTASLASTASFGSQATAASLSPVHVSNAKRAKQMFKNGLKGRMMSRRISEEMEEVLNAIDRLQVTSPRLVNQCVVITDARQRTMDLAATQGTVERLTRGRMEGQRATTRAMESDRLADNIIRANRSTMSNQAVTLSPALHRRLELAKLSGLLDRLSSSRMYNQEYMQRNEYRAHGIELLRQEIGKLSSPAMTAQRYELSATKERDMYLNSLMHRVDRLNDRQQLTLQSADSPSARKEKAFQEVDGTLDRMFKTATDMPAQRFCPTPNM